MGRTLEISRLAVALGFLLAGDAIAQGTGGVDGTVLDNYPDFVASPMLVLPGKGELPAQYLASAATPFVNGCDGVAVSGTVFANAEVEPHVAINPRNPNNLIGVWQQDRWSNGGARGLVTSVSFDGGVTWAQRAMPFSRCGGGNAGNRGDYARATDPWVTFSPDGTAHQMALSFSGGSFASGSVNAMLASRSLDGGWTWSNPIKLIEDNAQFFNDKNAMTADPTDSNYVYAVWDRLVNAGGGPAYFARTINGGASWQPARPIYDPGVNSQTIGNVIVVRPNGQLINLFTQIDDGGGGQATAVLALIRSSDKGNTWSPPIFVADLLALGASDPQTGTPIRDGSILAQIATGPNGHLHVVWQDSRFSGGVRDAIAYTSSSDGGLTWSAPLRISTALNVQAFMPAVHVSADGTIAVTYFDMRSNTSDPNTLLTDYWLTRSTDGIHWAESRVVAPFDLATAPNAGGLFVGDYQGLVSSGPVFIPFFAKTNSGDFSNRTDVYVAPSAFIVRTAVSTSKMTGPMPESPAFKRQVSKNIMRYIKKYVPGSSKPRRGPH